MATTTVRTKPIVFSAPMVRALLNTRPNVWPAEPIDPAKPFKWQTRRVVKPQPTRIINARSWDAEVGDVVIYQGEPVRLCESRGRHKSAAGELTPHRLPCPFGAPGDRLWVRECWADPDHDVTFTPVYRADSADPHPFRKNQRWRSPIHMPRWASRLTLEVVSVRVERVQDISEDDAIAEGVSSDCECWSCCDGEHAGCCRECAGWCATDGEDCKHCEATGNCPKCDGDCSGQELFARLWDSIHGKGAWTRNDWVWVYEFMRVEGTNQDT
jgi:hypothetical protein